MTRARIPLVVGWSQMPDGRIFAATGWGGAIHMGQSVTKIQARVGQRDLWLWLWNGRPLPQAGPFGFDTADGLNLTEDA